MNVLSVEKVRTLLACFERGLSERATERETGVTKNTVRYWKAAFLMGKDLLVERERILLVGSAAAKGYVRQKRGKYKPRASK